MGTHVTTSDVTLDDSMFIISLHYLIIDISIIPITCNYYNNPLTVQGDMTKDTLPDLNTILKKSYEYNVKQTVKEARKIGLRPSR